MRREKPNIMVGKMTTRNIVLFMAAASLAGCASMNGPATDQLAGVKNAVYVVNDGASASTLKAADGAMPTTVPGESKLMRIYWFLGGR
jgi:alkaline phosphatase